MSLVNDLWTYRGLVGNLAQRELKGRYKRSVLGWLWSLLNPAATLATYAFVFGTLFKPDVVVAGNGHTKSFALFLFAALVVWNFFNSVVLGSMNSLIAAGPLLKKVHFPAECAPAANLVVGLIQAAIEASILMIIMAVIGNLSWALLLVPIVLALVGVFAFGIGLALSVGNVYLRDISYLVGVALNLLFYATPIVYTLSLVKRGPHWAYTLVTSNPIYLFVKAMRDCTYSGVSPTLGSFSILLMMSLVSFGLGWAIFRQFGADVSEEL